MPPSPLIIPRRYGNKLQGTAVSTTAPTNGQALIYNSTTTQWEPTTVNLPKKGSKTYNATLNAGSNTTTITVTGAVVGNSAQVSPTSDLGQNVFIQSSWVSATNTVSVRLFYNAGIFDPNTLAVNTTLVAVVY